MTIANFLADNLSLVMRELKVSVAELSQKTNVTVATIYKLKDGMISNPTIETLLPIAKYLGFTIEELVSTKLHNIQSINGIKITDCIPLIALRDVENYATAPVVKYIQTKFDDSQNIFALEVSETNILFEHGSILFVNPNLQYNNEDFVIVKKISNLSFSIKKVIFDDEYYLQSIHQALDKKLYNINEYIVCGVIVSCLKNLKRTN